MATESNTAANLTETLKQAEKSREESLEAHAAALKSYNEYDAKGPNPHWDGLKAAIRATEQTAKVMSGR